MQHLVVRGVHKSFDGRTPVLTDINLDIEAGESLALIGANGAGKSTLLRICAQLLKADQGEVHLFGQPTHGLHGRSLRQHRARIGFVFQKHNLVPRLCALSNVLHGALARNAGMGAWLHNWAPTALRAEAMACLDRVGLAHVALRRADQLSGGQSQRVAIARALMQKPQFIIADEPAASLDPVAGEEVMGLFTQLTREENITLAFTTHDLTHAMRYAGRVVGLQNGRISLDAPVAQVAEPQLRTLYA
ncbi:MAG: ATP-binding cassette domain-containing protein [Brachymonas sp.]|nr:ATP-binding cassette domain-containing protein [Brachymonas sp.]